MTFQRRQKALSWSKGLNSPAYMSLDIRIKYDTKFDRDQLVNKVESDTNAIVSAHNLSSRIIVAK